MPLHAKRTRLRFAYLGLLFISSLSACGGDDNGIPASTTPVSTIPTPDQLKAACPGLAGRAIAASVIGIASGSGTVVSATFVPAAAQTVAGAVTTLATPDYCRIAGTLSPVDPAAQLINFQLNLPTTWNGKALQYGGGGYNGTLVTGLAALRDAAPDDVLPISRGYATLGTDAGHQAASFAANNIGQFGLNDEMLINYGYTSYKKVKDASVSLMRAFYSQAPNRMYYFGGSEGGREGLTMAQRYPNDYDGIVSVVPVVQLSMLFQSYIPHQLPQFNGGWLSIPKVKAFAAFVAGSCDALDGLADGVVNNYLACPARVNLQGIRCAGGLDTGDTCLSDAQVATVSAVHTPYTFSFNLSNGLSSYPQWLYGNETSADPINPTMTRWVTGTAPPSVPVDAATASTQWLYGNNFVRFFVAKDGNFDARTYNPNDYMARLQVVSEIIDSTNPDLSAYFARGGKLIMRENMGDLAQSPIAGIAYYSSVAAKVGQAVVDQSARLYVSPASTHSGNANSVTDGSPVATMVDLLDPLDKWVTAGQAPADSLVQTVKATIPPFAVQSSRPMCRYPDYPRFTGADRTAAASYTCVLSTP